MSTPPPKRTCWLHLRLSPKEHEELRRRFRRTTCRKLSDYARRKLLDRPLTITYRNQSLDACMAELVRLRSELASLGHNFNQAVRKLHTLRHLPEFQGWLLAWEAGRSELLGKVEEIKKRVNHIADQWLQ